jgi:hypothetical protein
MISPNNDKVLCLKSNDDNFRFCNDGFTLTPRAGLEVSANCPSSVRMTIERAMIDGFIRPVAFIRESELIWGKLKD